MASRPSNGISRKALLVVPSYKGLPEERHLPGTAYDLRVMENVTEIFQFDVTKVLEDNATKENILKSLGNLSSTAKPGSVVLFYFSGHGYYLPRTKDEGLIPADATSEKLKDAGEEICITGIDLLPYWKKFAKNDVKVTVIFDCCHSGQLYRVIDLKNSARTETIRPRQVCIKDSSQARTLPAGDQSEGTVNKFMIRGGWTPNEKDAFFYFAACTPQQIAFEKNGGGGRLTMAIETVFNSIVERESSGKVSCAAFYRLIVREFKKEGWYHEQTPQLEGEKLDTELFGVDEVPSPRSGITVNEVNGDEVVLDGGCLQNLLPGEYDVFKTTAEVTDVEHGKKSSYWLGTIDVSEGLIGRVETSSKIVERNPDKDKHIRPGCLAFLTKPSNIKNNVRVNIPSDDSVPDRYIEDLLSHIDKTKIFNASKTPFKIEDGDLITIGIEFYETSNSSKKEFWVARQSGDVIVPPLSLGLEETMANNLNRYLRYKHALKSAESPENRDKLENVGLKVMKIEEVKPFKAESKQVRINEGLKSGEDLYKDASKRPVLKAHSLADPNSNKLNDESGDAFVFQVTNHNKEKKDVVHICVLFYEFDGAIKQIYPLNKQGKTTELRGEDTAENIFRVFIPSNSLRKMAEPNPTITEPKSGVDTIVVYATSKPADFGPLLQTALETDPDIIPRGKKEKVEDLSDLAQFLLPIRKRCVAMGDHPDEGFKYDVIKREFAVEENTKNA